jgi:hypothetical protein
MDQNDVVRELIAELLRDHRVGTIRDQVSDLGQSDKELARGLDEVVGLLTEDRLRLAALVRLLIAKGVFSAEEYANEITALRTSTAG